MLHINTLIGIWECNPIYGLVIAPLVITPIVESLLYRFIKVDNPASERINKWIRKAFRIYVSSVVVVFGSEITALQLGDTVQLANMGRCSAAAAAMSMMFFYAVKVATDHKIRASANREADRWGMRLFIGVPMTALTISVLLTIGSTDPVLIRGQEALFLSLGACVPMLCGRGFVLLAMQLSPWLSRYS